jgi:hypothetical protein
MLFTLLFFAAAFARTSLRLSATDENKPNAQSIAGSGPQFMERGVSVDQDGKSNVWAIEPKVEVETKSSEEKGAAAMLAGGGIAAFAAFAAVVLTNLPDPNQF